jgi:hypothetical protein
MEYQRRNMYRALCVMKFSMVCFVIVRICTLAFTFWSQLYYVTVAYPISTGRVYASLWDVVAVHLAYRAPGVVVIYAYAQRSGSRQLADEICSKDEKCVMMVFASSSMQHM